MVISYIRWTTGRVNHISKHKLTPDEVEEAAFDDPYSVIQKLKKSEHRQGKNIYRLLGKTNAGR